MVRFILFNTIFGSVLTWGLLSIPSIPSWVVFTRGLLLISFLLSWVKCIPEGYF